MAHKHVMHRIRRERLSAGWTQEYVANQVGLSKVAIHDIETDKQRPSFAVLVKLEDLFGTDYRTLFDLPPLQRREVTGTAPKGASQRTQDQDSMDG